MNKNEAEKALLVISDIMDKTGFQFKFILGTLFNEDNSISFPYHITFDENIFVEFLYKFLKEDNNESILDKLMLKFNPVDDGMKNFTKTVKF
jgi:hypothetical protein